MGLTFYFSPMSTASITELVLDELGVPCERVQVDIQKGDNKKPDYLKLNPNGKVPVLVHDGVALWESAALTMYLGELYGVDKKLYPAPGPKRGEAMKWIAWTNVTLGDAVTRFTRNTMDWFPADQKNEKAGAAAKQDIADLLAILDKSLDGKQYLVGDYTLADTHLNSYLDWLRHMKFDLAPYANINAWGKRCGARPAAAKMQAALDAHK